MSGGVNVLYLLLLTLLFKMLWTTIATYSYKACAQASTLVIINRKISMSFLDNKYILHHIYQIMLEF